MRRHLTGAAYRRGIAMLAGGALGACTPHTAPPPAPVAARPAVTPALAPPPRDELRALIDSLVAAPEFRNAFWGILVVDPARSDTLYALNAGKLFMPASNMKIVTGAVALATLGPDFQFHTAIAARGPVRAGILEGDLVVIGRGDPSVSDHMLGDPMLPFRAVADTLRAHGIRRIRGRVLRGGDAFPDPPFGYGWSWDDLVQPYAAGVNELLFNEGRTTVVVQGATRPGGPVRVRTIPIATYPPVRVHALTAAAAGGAPLAPISVAYDAPTGDLLVEGAIAPRDSIRIDVAYRDPAAAYLAGLTAALRERGIAVGPSPRIRPGVTHAAYALDTLARITSPPLRAILPALLKPSQNQIAEILLHTLGLERTGVGSADSGRRVVESQLAAWGADPTGYVVHDGSGLSRYDYLTPGTIVRVLTAIERDTAFDALYGALPVAGVDGTLTQRMRGTVAAGNVHAKTGYADRIRSLSGYVTTADDVRVVFSALCNNWTVPVHDVEVVQDAIAVRLATLRLRAP